MRSPLALGRALRARFVAALSSSSRSKLSSATRPVVQELERRVLLSGAPVAMYHLDEGTGANVADATTNANAGTLSASGAAWVTGRDGSGLSFSGSGYVDLGNPADLNFSGAITLRAWVKPTGTAGLQDIIAHGYSTSPSGEVFLRIDNGNYEAGAWNGGASMVSVPVPASDLNTWVHLAAASDGSTWTLYDNGTPLASGSGTFGAIPVNSNWAIGAGGNPGDRRGFAGSIDEVRIYDEALTGTQIQALSSTNPATLPPSVHFSPDAAWTLTGSPGAYTLSLSSGTLTLDDDISTEGSQWQGLQLILSSSAHAYFNSRETLGGLSLNNSCKVTVAQGGGGADTNLLIVNSLSIDRFNGATLDLTDNDLIWRNAGSYNLNGLTCEQYLQANLSLGLAGGTWTGAGLTSSVAAQHVGDHPSGQPNSNYTYALGYVLNNGQCISTLSSFDGVSVTSNDMLVKYTLAGDANLDGQVDWNDGYAIDSGRTSFPNHRYSWAAGNLDYNAFVDSNDYIPFNYTFGLTMADPNLVRVFQPLGIVLTLPENTAWSGDIATFTDSAHPGIAPADYQAFVSWGAGFTIAQVTADSSHPGGYRINALSPNLLAPSTVITVTVQYAPNATNGSGNPLQGRPAAVSEPVTITPAVANLSATAASTTSMSLAWTLNVANATGVEINRATDPSFSTFTTITLSSATATAYADTTLLEGRHYYYRIRAIQTSGDSVYSNTADAWTLPNAPTGLSAAAAGPNQVNLTWTNNSVITQFQVERSDDGTNFYPLDTVTGTSYQDIFVADATTYAYRVEALTDSGLASLPSNAASVSTPLAAPSDLQASGVSDSEIDLTWVNNSAGATGVTVQWSSDGSNWSDLAANLSADTSSYNDTGLSAGTQRYYRVLALGASQQAPSTNAQATTAPPTPTGVTASATAPDTVSLTWSAALGATSYEVSRGVGGIFVNIADLGASATSFTETGLLDNTPYAYQVIALNDTGSSSPASASATTPVAPPAAPSNVNAVAISGSAVQITWTNNATTDTKFHVQYQDDFVTWTALPDTDPNVTSVVDPTAQPTFERQYRVSAFNAGGTSGWVVSGWATPPRETAPADVPPRATGLVATAIGSTRIQLNWSPPAGYTGTLTYWVQRQRPGGNWGTIGITSTTTYSDTGVLPAQTYAYRVRSANASGPSLPSDTASAMVPPTAPPNPTSGQVFAYESGYEGIFHWDYNSRQFPVDGFHIYRVGSDGGETPYGTAGPDDRDWPIHGSADQRMITVRVRAYRVFNGIVLESDPGTGFAPEAYQLNDNPLSGSAPSLSASADSTGKVTFTSNVSLSSLVIECSDDGTNFIDFVSNGFTVLAPGAKCWFRARGSSFTPYSNVIEVDGPSLSPPAFTAHGLAGGGVQLDFNALADGGDVAIERSEDGVTWREITSGNGSGYTDVGTYEGQRFFYRMREKQRTNSSLPWSVFGWN